MSRTLAEWLEFIELQHPKSIELGLDRARAVAERMRLGRPARKVITVAGTNGKGSTVAFIEAIGRAAGWRTGAYSSPHLLAYNERVRIDGTDVDDAALVAGFEAVEAARGEVALTYFEHGTLCALWLFAREKLDLAVLEVGLGGRLDAVNIVDPDVAVITTVDIDHADWLGSDRESIGLEKAGIARPWTPLVLGDDDPPASVLQRAYAIGAPAIRANCDFFFEPLGAGRWCWRELGQRHELPMPRMAAPTQLRNAAVAVAAVRALGQPLPVSALAEGIAGASLPGRLQRFRRGGTGLLVDVGHNPQAARELARALDAAPVPGRTLAVFAALGDKDLGGIVAALGDRIDRWYLAGLEEVAGRGLAVDAFATQLAGTAAAGGERHPTVEAALAAALAGAGDGERVLVFGSFHTAAAALHVLGREGSG